jgi:serine/threonine protein kinase
VCIFEDDVFLKSANSNVNDVFSEGKPYGLASDVYSYGIVMWEIATSSDPFPWCQTARELEALVPKVKVIITRTEITIF